MGSVTIGTLSKRTGRSIETIRYHKRIRAIPDWLGIALGRDRGPPVVRRARAGADRQVRYRERKQREWVPANGNRSRVLPAPPRTRGGHRLYGEDHLRRLTFVRHSRELGIPLEEVRGLLRMIDGNDYTCDGVKALTLNHLAEIRRKIADLSRLEKVFKEMAAQCERGSVPNYPIFDALFDTRS